MIPLSLETELPTGVMTSEAWRTAHTQITSCLETRNRWPTLSTAGSGSSCLSSEALCERARHRTGLEDFGDPPIEPALSILIDSLKREANLHSLGQFLLQVHLRDLLATRLRLTSAWRDQAGRLNAPAIQRPIFIVGMPRTGSTFLHELLSEDPASRSPRAWEIMFPLGNPGRPEMRVVKAAACLWWFRRLAPKADVVYPIRARTPHECVAIHSYTMLSEEFVSTAHVPSYEAFLHATDFKPVYLWQKRFLQHLSGSRPTRWVLKSPDHVQSLEALFAVFPDALIIQTHRDPLQVVKSSIQLTQVLQGLYGRGLDPGQVAQREARVLAERMERFMRFREDHPELSERFVDVHYSDLVGNPLHAVRRIYRRLQLPLSVEATTRMNALASKRSRYGHRKSAPSLYDCGLDPSVEARRFQPYCSRFGIDCKPVPNR